MSDDLVTALAKAQYEAMPHMPMQTSVGYRWFPWDELPQEERDLRHDAMWQALKLLREPTEEMAIAAYSADWSAYPMGESHTRLFTAMIDRLLEVK